MLSVVSAMLETYPGPSIQVDPAALTDCVSACVRCSLACTACADACMVESDIAVLVRCIRTDLDCADMCNATVRVLTRLTASNVGVMSSVVNACLATIVACAEECERHAAHHKHCEVSAMVCRDAEEACRKLLTALDVAPEPTLDLEPFVP